MCVHHTQAVTEPPVKFPAHGYRHIPEDLNAADRHLLLLMGSLGNRVADIITGLFEDNLSRNEQLASVDQAAELAEEFRQRARRISFVLGAEAA
jgi:hypothetical protein